MFTDTAPDYVDYLLREVDLLRDKADKANATYRSAQRFLDNYLTENGLTYTRSPTNDPVPHQD